MFVTWLISYDACGFSTYLYKIIFRNIIGLWEYVGYTVFITVWLYMISLCDPANNNADGKLCHLSCSTQGKYLITPFLIKAYHTTYILLLIKLVVKKLRAMHGMHLMMIRQLRISSDNACLQDMPSHTSTAEWLLSLLEGWNCCPSFHAPPCMIAHTFLLFWTLYYYSLVGYSLCIQSIMHAPHTTQIKSNQNSILLRSSSFFFSVLVDIFLQKGHLPPPLSLSFLWN